MQAGETIQIKAYKSDGTCYRSWHTTVEFVEANRVVVVTPANHSVQEGENTRTSKYAMRGYYWSDRMYSLLEVYTANGQLDEIYININSPAVIEDTTIHFTDYELDVSRELPHAAQIVDEDEFEEAVVMYGYPEEFQQMCYRVAKEGLGIADHWSARGMPGK